MHLSDVPFHRNEEIREGRYTKKARFKQLRKARLNPNHHTAEKLGQTCLPGVVSMGVQGETSKNLI